MICGLLLFDFECWLMGIVDCFWVFYFGFVNLGVVGGLFGLVLWWFVFFFLVLGLGIWIVWMCLGWCVFCFVVV